MKFINRIILLLVITSTIFANPASRLKDITRIKGSSDRKIVGYGIVVGLDGTGDGSKSIFTVQSIANMLQHFGVSVDKNNLKPKNVAAVIVTANLPSYGKKGAKIDVTVSSLGDAKSLQGGNLLLTPLTDPLVLGKSQVYAIASGPISIGGFNLSAGGGNAKIRKNYSLVGRIPSGASIELEQPENFVFENSISLVLDDPDYTTAVRIAKTINNFMGEEIAYSVDKAEVKINLPEKYINNQKVMEFIALIEVIKVRPDDIAKVVVNERTGTIIIGQDVKLDPVAISHGNLSIKIGTKNKISQPNALSLGETANQSNTDMKVEEDIAKVIKNNETATLGELVKSLNKLGVTPRDMISIFQALKEAGALHAELVLL